MTLVNFNVIKNGNLMVKTFILNKKLIQNTDEIEKVTEFL